MNTKFYRGMEESDSLRNSRPVKEVWAVFPKEIPPRGDEDFSSSFHFSCSWSESERESGGDGGAVHCFSE